MSDQLVTDMIDHDGVSAKRSVQDEETKLHRKQQTRGGLHFLEHVCGATESSPPPPPRLLTPPRFDQEAAQTKQTNRHYWLMTGGVATGGVATRPHQFVGGLDHMAYF